MPRYEITGTANERYGVNLIQNVLREVGAKRVNLRRAFGWSNQPRVVTFAAADQAEADRICEAAHAHLGGRIPSLLPYPYRA